MKKITVLGSGMVGRAMIEDLSKKHKVLAADISMENLKELKMNDNITILEIDLSQKENVQKIIQDCDLVIGAVPGFMGFQTVKTVIESGKNIVDISFFPEDAFLLDELAKQHNVITVVDCGVAPGMSNMILGYHNSISDLTNFECYVGGLPFNREFPYEYKAPFSPIDVIEEYIRPARYVKNGELVTMEALSEPEIMEFEEVGELEAFNTDGLRSIIKTMNIKDMKEKTLRYPGHIDLMKALRETGFLSSEETELNGQMIKPIDLTTKLLFPIWKLGKNEHEFTIMKIIIEGKDKKVTYSLFDKYDAITEKSSMARTTGYACTATAELVLNNDYTKIGISPPEFVGAEEGCLQKVFEFLKDRNILFKEV
jgi:lysine 6-dehydrogenase